METGRAARETIGKGSISDGFTKGRGRSADPMAQIIRIIGIDPGLRTMGWGIIDLASTGLSYVASGLIHSNENALLASRLSELHQGLAGIIARHAPQEAAVEETFVNRDPQSALRLGQARGIALVVPALAGLTVAEYAANLIKKSISGNGHAEKSQIALMVKFLLPRSNVQSADAADALAVAITHAHHRMGPSLAAARVSRAP